MKVEIKKRMKKGPNMRGKEKEGEKKGRDEEKKRGSKTGRKKMG
jgi:hypothetical protein